jgi:hypothetical protein
MSARRLFVLLEWDEEIGAAIKTVGVLGTEPGREAVTEWVPGEIDALVRWYWRLAEGVEPERLEAWLDERASLGMAEAEDPGAELDLRTAVAVVLDARLAEPMIPDPVLAPIAEEV